MAGMARLCVLVCVCGAACVRAFCWREERREDQVLELERAALIVYRRNMCVSRGCSRPWRRAYMCVCVRGRGVV